MLARDASPGFAASRRDVHAE
jgi:hypothetical protein